MAIYHKHHIIPKHMGGTDDPSNLVEVTIEQHAALHKQLWVDLGHWQDEIAWKCLSGHITHSEAIKMAQRNYMKNRVVSLETRRKMSESRRGIKQNPEIVEKRRLRNIGKKKTYKDKERWRNNISKGKKGYVSPFRGIKRHTEESKEKNRLAHLGKSINKGRVFSKVCCDLCEAEIASNRLAFHKRSDKCKKKRIINKNPNE